MDALNRNRNVYLDADVLTSGLIIPINAVQISHSFSGLIKAATEFGYTNSETGGVCYVWIAGDNTVDVVCYI